MKNPFTGPWRIVWMSGWDQDYVDMDVPGHITFETARSGSFQFGLVQGQMIGTQLLDLTLQHRVEAGCPPGTHGICQAYRHRKILRSSPMGTDLFLAADMGTNLKSVAGRKVQ